jgi:1-acyl-sn-glycerol-3-phosphate acyltransferase
VREPVEELFPRFSGPVYRIAVATVGRTVRRLYRVQTEGLDRLPDEGPAIVAANHVSFLDPLSITSVMPRRITYLAKREFFEAPTTRWLFTIAGQIPVDRDEPTDAPMSGGMQVLAHGGVLGVHPEGTRSPDGRLYRGRTGVARLAAATRAPVIPAGVRGTYPLMPKGSKLPKMRGHVTVRFGEPMRYDDASTLRDFTDELMRRIAALSGQEYCDEYASAIRSSAPR